MPILEGGKLGSPASGGQNTPPSAPPGGTGHRPAPPPPSRAPTPSGPAAPPCSAAGRRPLGRRGAGRAPKHGVTSRPPGEVGGHYSAGPKPTRPLVWMIHPPTTLPFKGGGSTHPKIGQTCRFFIFFSAKKSGLQPCWADPKHTPPLHDLISFDDVKVPQKNRHKRCCWHKTYADDVMCHRRLSFPWCFATTIMRGNSLITPFPSNYPIALHVGNSLGCAGADFISKIPLGILGQKKECLAVALIGRGANPFENMQIYETRIEHPPTQSDTYGLTDTPSRGRLTRVPSTRDSRMAGGRWRKASTFSTTAAAGLGVTQWFTVGACKQRNT